MARTHANRGQSLEELIKLANIFYRQQKIAIIHKVPTEWIPIRGRTGKISSAKVEEKAAVDFIGHYRGIPIAFDAKHTMKMTIRWDRVEQHQQEFLADWSMQGLSFILVSFNMQRFFLVPWSFWQDGLRRWKTKQGSASLNMADLKTEWEIKAGGKYALDYLQVVDRVIKEVEQCG